MKKKRFFGLVFTTLLFALVFIGCSNEEASEITDVVEGQENWPTKLRFAETGTEDVEELQRSFGPFQEILEEILEVEIEFYPVPNHTMATDALEFDQVDIVLAGPSEYDQIKEVIPWIQTLAVMERDAHKAAIIVHDESDYQTLEDIKGSKIALIDTESTSGFKGPADTFVVSPNLPEEFVIEMQRRIVENKEEIIESILASDERDQYNSAKTVEANDSDYD